MLLAVPGLAVARILFVHFYETRVLGNWDYLSATEGKGRESKQREEEEEPADEEETGLDLRSPSLPIRQTQKTGKRRSRGRQRVAG